MSEVQKRIKRIEETLGEALDVPMSERIQIVNILYNDSGEAFEKAKREKLKELRRKYGKTVDETRLLWVAVLNFGTPAGEKDPL